MATIPTKRCPKCNKLCMHEPATNEDGNFVINYVCVTPGCANVGETIAQIADPNAKRGDENGTTR